MDISLKKDIVWNIPLVNFLTRETMQRYSQTQQIVNLPQ